MSLENDIWVVSATHFLFKIVRLRQTLSSCFKGANFMIKIGNLFMVTMKKLLILFNYRNSKVCVSKVFGRRIWDCFF